MQDFLLYILEIGISLFLFYSIFWLFLKSETYFQVNRYYITLSLIVSLLVPLINISFSHNSSEIIYYNLISTVVVTADGFENVVRNHLNSSQLILIIYLLGVGVFLLRFIYQMLSLIFIILKSDVKHYSGLKYVLTDKHMAPFSFFNYIFISKKIESEDLKKILIHESIHAKQWHSIDVLILEMLAILQWFNPFIWFYKNSMQEVHEYLADRGVLSKGFNPKEYQKLIYNQVFGINNMRLANSLNYSLTKRRFIMMTKIKSPKSAIFRIFLFIPVIVLVVLAFSCSNEELKENEVVKVANSNNTELDGKVYEKVDVMPTYPGGDLEIRKFIASGIVYPKEAAKLGVSGKVFVAFVVNSNGKVVDVKVKEGIADNFSTDKGIDGFSEYDAAKLIEEEALRIVSILPDWTPGKIDGKNVNVQFTIPIAFKLD